MMKKFEHEHPHLVHRESPRFHFGAHLYSRDDSLRDLSGEASQQKQTLSSQNREQDQPLSQGRPPLEATSLRTHRNDHQSNRQNHQRTSSTAWAEAHD